MSASRDEPLIEYAICSDGDADAMARLLGEAFSRRDPPAVAVGLTAHEFEAFARLYCARAAIEGLTVVARHAGTRALVGVLLTEDAAADPPSGLERLSPKFAPIFDMLERLDAKYGGGRPVCAGESLHLLLLGVTASAAGQGVAQHLVSTCLAHGARRGYRLAVTEATTRRPSTSSASKGLPSGCGSRTATTPSLGARRSRRSPISGSDPDGPAAHRLRAASVSHARRGRQTERCR